MLQAAVARHSHELSTSSVSVAQLMDCEGRLGSRVGALSEDIEQRLSDVVMHACKAAAQQGQGQYEALRDRLQSEIAALSAQVCPRHSCEFLLYCSIATITFKQQLSIKDSQKLSSCPTWLP
jgi:hypothetical protein